MTALAVTALLVAGAPAATAAVTSGQAVAFLNAQRAANGIPGDLANDPNLEVGCQQHNRYMEANGSLDHGESPSNPYYTPEGAGEGPWEYRGEVLHYEGYDGGGQNPWEWAPIHLYLMLDPERTTAGYDSAGYTCMRMGGSRAVDFEETPRFFSYPGPGTQGIYPEEIAFEAPYVPQQLVGIPEGVPTGPNILLFSLGTAGLDAESFSITGPSGQVPARMVDEDTENEVGSGHWFRGGGVLIPEQPLAAHTAYEVSVLWRNLAYGEFEGEGGLGSAEFFTQQFTFTTGERRVREVTERPTRTPFLTLRRKANRGKAVRFRLRADPVLIGRRARLAVYRHEKGCGRAYASPAGSCGWRRLGPPRRRSIELRRTRTITVTPLRNRWQRLTVKVRTRGFQEGEVRILPVLARAMAWGRR